MAQDREKLVVYKKQCREFQAKIEELDNELTQYRLVESKADGNFKSFAKSQ